QAEPRRAAGRELEAGPARQADKQEEDRQETGEGQAEAIRRGRQMTPSPGTIAPTRPELVTDGFPQRRPRWIELATSPDHKDIGRMFIAAALGFLFLAAIELCLMRLPLAFLPNNGVDVWLTAVGMICLGYVLWAINMIATLRVMRAPGLAWRRMAPFAWSGAVCSWLLFVIASVMLAAITMLMIDRNFNG